MNEDNAKQFTMGRAAGASLWVCQCGWEKCEPLHSFGPAMRDHYILHYIVDGKGSYKNQNISCELSAGQGFLISPREVVSYAADDNEPWEYYWVGFNGVDAEYLLEKCGISMKSPVLTTTDTQKLRGLFTDMFDAFQNYKTREYTMLAYFYLILSDLMERNAGDEARSTGSQLYLESAVSYINDNYAYDISVAGLAKYIGVDRSYLYRIFMESIGLSPEKYIIKVRMTHAANILKTTDLSVVQVALSTGYRDISHFSNVFKRFFGASPTAYRSEKDDTLTALEAEL